MDIPLPQAPVEQGSARPRRPWRPWRAGTVDGTGESVGSGRPPVAAVECPELPLLMDAVELFNRLLTRLLPF